MPKKIPEYCRNAEDIGRALGLKVPSRKQRNKFTAFLQQVNGWSRNEGLPADAPPFPEKQRNGYWLVKDVAAWQAASDKGRVASGKSGTKTKAGNSSLITHHPLLPPQPDAPGPEDDLFLRPASDEDKKIRINSLFTKWLEGKSTKRDEEELFRAGKITADQVRDHDELDGDPAAGGSINIGGGYRGVANFINRNFPWVNCNHEKVQRWVRSDYLPPGCTEPFPPPDDGNRFKRVPVEAWVNRWYPKPSATGQNLALSIVEMRDEAEKEQIEHDRWLREMERAASDRNYIRVDEMLGYADEVGRVVFGVPYRLEKDLMKLGVNAADAAAFMQKLCTEIARGLGDLKQRAAAED